MSHLKLVIFVYLAAFAIFGHVIEHMGSSTAALVTRVIRFGSTA